MSGFKGVDCYKKAAPSGRLLRETDQFCKFILPQEDAKCK